MNEIKGKYYLIDDAGHILRFGLNGGGQYDYCVYRGKIVLFDTCEDAVKAWSAFPNKNEWDIVRI